MKCKSNSKLLKQFCVIIGIFVFCFESIQASSINDLNHNAQYGVIRTATSPSWEIFYGLDSRFLEPNPNNPGIKNKNNIKGTFSNSAAKFENCYATLRYWKSSGTLDEYFDMLIYEYDYMFPVTNNSISDYSKYYCTIRFNNTDYNFTAKLIKNELVFDINGQNYLKFFMNSGVAFKIYIEEYVSYIQPSTYLFEINSMGFQPLYSQLNTIQ